MGSALRTPGATKSDAVAAGRWGAAPTLQGHSVKSLAAYTPFEVLEGENVEGVFVAEWPCMEVRHAP
jgi:hypothetical protein